MRLAYRLTGAAVFGLMIGILSGSVAYAFLHVGILAAAIGVVGCATAAYIGWRCWYLTLFAMFTDVEELAFYVFVVVLAAMLTGVWTL